MLSRPLQQITINKQGIFQDRRQILQRYISIPLRTSNTAMNMATGEVCGTAGKTLNLAFTFFLDDCSTGSLWTILKDILFGT